MESLACLGVTGSYCIGERRIDDMRPMWGNAAGTSDDGAATWVTFTSRYDTCKVHIIFNAMTTSMEAVEFDVIQRSVYHEGVIARISFNLQLLTEIVVKPIQFGILSISVGSRIIYIA